MREASDGVVLKTACGANSMSLWSCRPYRSFLWKVPKHECLVGSFKSNEAGYQNGWLRLQHEIRGDDAVDQIPYAEAVFSCLPRWTAALLSSWFNCCANCAAVSGGKASRQMRCPPI